MAEVEELVIDGRRTAGMIMATGLQWSFRYRRYRRPFSERAVEYFHQEAEHAILD